MAILKRAAIVRSILFNISFFIAHVGLVLMMGIFSWLPERAVVWMLEFTMKTFAFLERYVLGLRYEVKGLENLPKTGAYIFASKHQSIWETYKLHILFRNPAVIMKSELMKIPAWGALARKVESIGVDRGAGASSLKSLIRGGRRAKERGRAIVIFPQGTRLAPDDYRPYKYGVAALYEALQVPLVPAALNSGIYWPRHSFFKRSGTIQVEILPPIPPGLKGAVALQQLEEVLEPAAKRLADEAKAALQL